MHITQVSLCVADEAIEVRLGSSYKHIGAKFGQPIEEFIKSSFWGRKISLYKIDNANYCVIDYSFSRVKNMLAKFLICMHSVCSKIE